MSDSSSHKSLNKIKFKSPYWDIQNNPEMVIDSNHVIWIISTTRLYDYEDMGYIMKFTITNDQVEQKDFKLPGNYCIREIEDHKVYLTKTWIRTMAIAPFLAIPISTSIPGWS